MQKFNQDDLVSLKQYIERQQRPLFIETDSVKVALVISEAAKIKYANEGYFSLTLNDLNKIIKEEKTFKEQQQVLKKKIDSFKEFQKSMQKTKEVFNGKIKKFEIEKGKKKQ